MLRKDAKFKYDAEQNEAFERLKQMITQRPVLSIFKYGLETEVHTDASKIALAAILMQRSNEDNQFHPVSYMSVKTSEQEQKWNSYELEVYAVIVALRKWRVYLLGSKFKVITDCKAFESTMQKKTIPKLARWALEMQQYEVEIIHRPGERMRHVDALSRVYYLQDTTLTSILKKNQDEDERIYVIREIIEAKGNFRDYFIKNNLLYRKIQGNELIVVPESMNYEIIRRAHENGHFKTRKMEEIITKEFFIPNLREKIERFVRSCVTCILAEKKAGKQEGLLYSIDKDDKPIVTFHMDHLGPMPSTSRNYKYILTIVDAFTKFTWIFPVETVTTDETLKKLRTVTHVFGNPARLITDRGTAFTSSSFKEFCTGENIELIHTTTGVPRGNGQVERIHRIIIPALTKLSIDEPEKWYQNVKKVQLFLNKTQTRSTGTSPSKLFFGVQIRTTEDYQLQEIMDREAAELFNEDRDQLRERAREQILRIQQENARTYNSKRKPATIYSIGDHVAIRRTQFGTGLKLKPKNYGPYRVIAVKGHDRYTVEKIGIHEGPFTTETSADYMMLWPQNERSFVAECRNKK